jgi:Kdo2-lipid IVA lauroyltransferase/acyltransferase
VEKIFSLTESIAYYAVKAFGVLIRRLPIQSALSVGQFLGMLAYYFDFRHKSLVYTNLKIAFAGEKQPQDIKHIIKSCFRNYGQNFIELLRLPLMNAELFKKYIQLEGQEHVEQALQQNKGVILLAMHFGSWELASLTCAMMGHPYKVIVKPQKKFSQLDDLLNSYRECGGSVVIERGLGTREFVKGLKDNCVIGMVVDQGGKEGMLVPFFNRQASMSLGAIRMGLKWGVPICFSFITRVKGPYHRLLIHRPLELENTGDTDKDIQTNLCKVTRLMEQYIKEFPAEYMWFYKIWKYSKETVTAVLHDGRTGHLRQSQSVARQLDQVLKERGITATTKVLEVTYKSKIFSRILSALSVFVDLFAYQGRIGFLRWFLTEESYRQLMSVKADTVISCGSSTAAINYLLANDQQAKSIAILRPGLLNITRYDLVILPQHDVPAKGRVANNVVITKGAPNLIDERYLDEQTGAFLRRFSHLQIRDKYMMGLLLGGDTKANALNENIVKIVINQIREALTDLDADILVTTSRRTPKKIENLVQREFKRLPACRLLIIASSNNVPEAVGGMLGVSDLVIVSGDSISMVSEAACSGKKTIVFPVRESLALEEREQKHGRFIQMLHNQGYLYSSDPQNIKQAIYSLAKNKIQTRKLDDNPVIAEGLRQVI